MFFILGKLPTLNLSIKGHPSLRYLVIFSDAYSFSVKLPWLQMRDNKCNITLLIDIIHKTVEPSHLKKLQIIHKKWNNLNKLMFQVILIFSDWIWIKQMIVSSTLFVLGETWETKAWVKIHRFNASSRNVKTIKLKNVSHTWWNIQIKK